MRFILIYLTLNLFFRLIAEPTSKINVDIKNNVNLKTALNNHVNEYLLKYFLDTPRLNVQEKRCDLYTSIYNDVELFGIICSKKIVYVAAKSLRKKALNEPENWKYLKEFIAVDFSKYYKDNQIGGFVYFLEDNSRVDWSELNKYKCIKSDSINTDPRTIQYGEDEGWQDPSYVCVAPPIILLWIERINQITGKFPSKPEINGPTVHIGYYEPEQKYEKINYNKPVPLKYVEVYDYMNSSVLIKILKFNNETSTLKNNNLFSQPFVDIYHANLSWREIGNNKLHDGWRKNEKGFHKILKRRVDREWDFSDQPWPKNIE